MGEVLRLDCLLVLVSARSVLVVLCVLDAEVFRSTKDSATKNLFLLPTAMYSNHDLTFPKSACRSCLRRPCPNTRLLPKQSYLLWYRDPMKIGRFLRIVAIAKLAILPKNARLSLLLDLSHGMYNTDYHRISLYS